MCGNIREAVIGAHHPYAARRIGRDIRRRRRWFPHDDRSASLQREEAEDAGE
jgi:hypothetical protein